MSLVLRVTVDPGISPDQPRSWCGGSGLSPPVGNLTLPRRGSSHSLRTAARGPPGFVGREYEPRAGGLPRVRTAATICWRCGLLDVAAAPTAFSALSRYLRRRQHDDPRLGSRLRILGSASRPSITGMPRSRTTTSGCSTGELDRLGPIGRLPHDHDVGLEAQLGPQEECAPDGCRRKRAHGALLLISRPPASPMLSPVD